MVKYILLFLALFLQLCRVLSSDVGLTPIQMIKNHGYPCETHYVTTEDGYILTYYRIPHGIIGDSSSSKPAVLLQHGFISSAADFVNMGPGRSLGYLLADAGYDVWIGNSRGNTFSKNHTTLNPTLNKKQFYDFSWHEIGYYDYPAAIDYILKLNNQDSLYFVAHSQGTTAFFVMASSRPEYNKKIKVAHLLAPAAYMGNPPNPSIKLSCLYIDQYAAMLQLYLVYEVPNTEYARNWGTTYCVYPEFYATCESVYYTTLGIDITQVEAEMLPVIASNAPADAAIKQLMHYGQIIKNDNFARYDYGFLTNLQVYGTYSAPSYDLGKITAPVAMYWAVNDGLLSEQDVRRTMGELPNVVEFYQASYSAFNHYDFLFAKDVVKYVYSELMEVMKKF